ncbi:unnamed protein product [Camellia sinensis]
MGSPQIEATFDTIIEAFLFLDKNGDGKLNKNDMVKALNGDSPLEISPAHVTRTRFEEMDWERKGKVSLPRGQSILLSENRQKIFSKETIVPGSLVHEG